MTIHFRLVIIRILIILISDNSDMNSDNWNMKMMNYIYNYHVLRSNILRGVTVSGEFLFAQTSLSEARTTILPVTWNVFKHEISAFERQLMTSLRIFQLYSPKINLGLRVLSFVQLNSFQLDAFISIFSDQNKFEPWSINEWLTFCGSCFRPKGCSAE